MNAIWAVRSLGIDPATGDEIFLTKDGETTTEWKAEDQVVCGDAMPDCSGTFGINMDYRGIFLNMSFYYQFGGQTYNQTLGRPGRKCRCRVKCRQTDLQCRLEKTGRPGRFFL